MAQPRWPGCSPRVCCRTGRALRRKQPKLFWVTLTFPFNGREGQPVQSNRTGPESQPSGPSPPPAPPAPRAGGRRAESAPGEAGPAAGRPGPSHYRADTLGSHHIPHEIYLGLVKSQEASRCNRIFCGHLVQHLFISSFLCFPNHKLQPNFSLYTS